ncbi:uncharacterized protein B0P05DRAFT_522223 [Gilbertella persicaria]|uniref:uncharacterized protein n=1 Tax=Gilbertella persicaria TaxID=101096 RepID=UPI00222054C9|nr:uncharacterized protein B0P05DRAFT_522223 [Gilbertella persicaria]KAI8097823.1 hypothetical protein B0P05DRAFT_522223 [Gilbertella persicaria]
MYKEIEPQRKSNLYFVHALSEQDWATKKLRGFSDVRLLFQCLNSSFFSYVESKEHGIPLPRFYIAKNRTLLHQAKSDPNGALAILYNAQLTPKQDTTAKNLYQLQATVVLCEPVGETHNFDDSSMDKSREYEFCPKAWAKLKVQHIVHNVSAVIDADIDRNYFKKAYSTFRLSTKIPADPKKIGNNEIAKQFARSILEPVSSKPLVTKPASSINTKEVTASSSSKELPANKESQASEKTIPTTPATAHSKVKTSVVEVQKDVRPPTPIAALSKIKTPVVQVQKDTKSPTPPTAHSKRKFPVADVQKDIRSPTPPTTHIRLTVPTIETSEKDKGTKGVTTANQEDQTVAMLDKILTHTKNTIEKSTEKNAIQEASARKEPSDSHNLTIKIPSSEVQQSRSKSSTPTKSLTSIRLVLKQPSSEAENSKSAAKHQPLNKTTKFDEARNKEYDSDSNSASTASYEYSDEEIPRHVIELSSGNVEDTIQQTANKPAVLFERYLEYNSEQTTEASASQLQASEKQYYLEASKKLWQKIRRYANEKGVPVVNIDQYNINTSSIPNAEGFFKHVFFLNNDSQKVIQTFKRMTITQRTTEIAGLLALKNLPHMGQITEVLQESHGEIIGLCMQRYQKTLKQYTHAHSHHRLTAYQKMDLVIQMLECIETIHSIGLAHRDLSEVNFMVNETNTKLRDGSPKAELFLIDYGKSAFTRAEDYRRWWVEQPRLSSKEYDGETVPRTKNELDIWCQRLPWMKSKPDHGYRLYRSIQTLPKSRIDTDDLSWLVNPLAEDLYSLGTLIWKTFSETEPWYGILDSDIRALRDTVGDDYRIQKTLEREVPGKLSRELLSNFLKVHPEQRKPASQVLSWLRDINVQNGLIAEWESYAPVRRQKRHAKSLSRYDDQKEHMWIPRKKNRS